MKKISAVLLLIFLVSIHPGCMAAAVDAKLPSGKTLRISFYPGGQTLDDLLIIGGLNYFGKAQYQIDDPLGDIGFRLKGGARVQAECISIGKNIVGDNECKIYKVYRSSFSLIPQGTIIPRPQLF